MQHTGTDREYAMHRIKTFLTDDNKKSFLLRGEDDDAKIKAAIVCLSAFFKKGIIRTSNMQATPALINGAFNRQLVPPNILSTVDYALGGGLTAFISRYDGQRTKRNPVGNQHTFTLFLLADTALDDPKRYDALVNEIADCKSRKILVITTKDRAVKNWDIRNHVDTLFTYGARR